MIYGTVAEARKDRREYALADGSKVWTNHIISFPEADRENPNAFLVEQGPGTVRPHFHFTDQFQVIVAGSARLGRHKVRPLTVHYARAQTGYGPIVAGAEGLDYLNLRPVTEHGVNYLPEAAPLADSGLPRRQVTSEPFDLSTSAALHVRTVVSVETVLPEEPNGAAAWLLRLPPGASLPSPQSGPWSGRYVVVMAGSMLIDDTVLPALSPVWILPTEALSMLRAGSEGLDALVVQFGIADMPAQPAA